MKFDWDKKNTVNVITGVLVFVISILFYFIFSNIKIILNYTSTIKYILMPFIVGGAIAYILNFFVKFFEKLILKIINLEKINYKIIRAISIIITYFITFIFIFFILRYIIPQFYSNIKSIIEKTPDFLEKIIDFVREKLKNVEISPEVRGFINEKLTDFAGITTKFLTNMIGYLASFATKLITLFLNTILAIIISIYILYDKEGFSKSIKKFMIAFFPMKFNKVSYKLLIKFDDTLKSYLRAKGIGAIIIGIIFYIILLIMNIEYSLLFSFILGITNLIPWFGCYLGAIPIAIVMLFISSYKTVIWFIIMVVVVATIDANIISPKLSSKSLGINSFWVIFALVLGGSLFGVVGFLLSVPAFVVIYSTVKEIAEAKIEKKEIYKKFLDKEGEENVRH